MKKLVIILAALFVFGIPSALFAGEWEIELSFHSGLMPKIG